MHAFNNGVAALAVDGKPNDVVKLYQVPNIRPRNKPLMRSVKMTGKITLSAAAGLLLAVAQANAATPPALYTAAQASAGAGVFTQSCAMCHGANLQGGAGPALLGQSFAPAAANHTVGAIFTLIATKMPLGSPGSLTHDQYTDVMAYILTQNGYPAGSTALDYTTTLASTTPLVSQVK
jgi:mono/diheme cytochrome c family protein